MRKIVPGYGPKTAKLLVIGEAPGRQEVEQGRPFVGPSGKLLRETLSRYGIDPERDVYYDNVIPFNPGSLTGLSDAQVLQLIEEHAGHLLRPELDWARERNDLVILAVGRWATSRLFGELLFGKPTPLPINMWAGSEVKDPTIKIGTRTTFHPSNVYVATMHPAGILRDPHRDALAKFRRIVYRAAKYATRLQPFTDRNNPDVVTSQGGFFGLPDPNTEVVYFDTEFDSDTYKITMLGYSTGPGQPVYQTTSYAEIKAFFEHVIKHNIKLVAHNIAADARAVLETYGLTILRKVNGSPVYEDTMLLHSIMAPDSQHSLATATLEYVGGIAYWKWMADRADLFFKYNAMDVWAMAFLHRALKEEASSITHFKPWTAYDLILRSVPMAMYIEMNGMKVDPIERQRLRGQLKSEMVDVANRVKFKIKDKIEERYRNLYKKLEEYDTTITTMKDMFIREAKAMVDDGHDYSFKTKPPCPDCEKIYNVYVKQRVKALDVYKKEKNKIKNKIKRLDEAHGFDPGNDNDLRWYITEVLGVKTRRRTGSGLVKVDVDSLRAIAPGDEIVELCWKYRHNRKLISTFIDGIKPDDNNVVHPRIKLHGTATGRPSSGSDQDDERLSNSLVFNAFNLPKEVRSQFVPDRKDHVFIAGDYADLEGRLVALEAGDRRLCKYYVDGIDMHSYLAAKLFGIDPSEARTTIFNFGTHEYTARDIAKRAGHATRYGMDAAGMVYKLGIPRDVAEKFQKVFDEEFPMVRRWQRNIVSWVYGDWHIDVNLGRRVYTMKPKRYLVTVGGRIRYFLGISKHKDGIHRALAFSPQSNGAFVWYKMLNRLCFLDGTPRSMHLKEFPEARFVIGTYDSLLVSCPRDQAVECARWIKQEAERPIEEFLELPGAAYMSTSFPMEVKIASDYSETGAVEVK